MEELPKLLSVKDLKGIHRSDLLEIIDGIPLVEEINIYLQGMNREDAQRSSGYYSPSSISYCARAMFYQRTGVQQNECVYPATRVIFEIGHAVHEMLQGWLMEILGDDCFRTEVLCIDEELHLKRSADELLELPNERRMLEIKSISPKGYEGLTRPLPGHLLQAHCYAHMMDTPLIWFLYFNKSNGEMRTFDAIFDKKIWNQVVDKLDRVERCVQKGNPPPKEIGRGCNECKFAWHCDPYKE